jgi:hypothetical protein
MRNGKNIWLYSEVKFHALLYFIAISLSFISLGNSVTLKFQLRTPNSWVIFLRIYITLVVLYIWFLFVALFLWFSYSVHMCSLLHIENVFLSGLLISLVAHKINSQDSLRANLLLFSINAFLIILCPNYGSLIWQFFVSYLLIFPGWELLFFFCRQAVLIRWMLHVIYELLGMEMSTS